jgi:NitT/TauT family transport system ATP-binding protein
MVKFLNVTKSFNGIKVLDGLSFDIGRGEIVSILGPSGIGKTTILRLVTSDLKPDSGRVEVKSSRIGYIFQEPRLLPWRTAVDNVSLGLRAAGMNKKEAGKIAIAWMERLSLKGFENYYPAQLSGGMVQRVSIGRAFAIEPEILLMDEPFTGLDVELKNSLMDLIEGILRDYQTTVIYVTHDFPEAVRLSDRAFKLLPGHVFEEMNINDYRATMEDAASGALRDAFLQRHEEIKR